MKRLKIDTGVEEFCINGNGVLRFNPADPNLYDRFFSTQDALAEIETELREKAQQNPDAVQTTALMHTYDARVKALLKQVFGEENDFDAALGGVNIMSVASNGERVLTNLFAALAPILEKGAQRHLQESAQSAVTAAEERRAALAQ